MVSTKKKPSKKLAVSKRTREKGRAPAPSVNRPQRPKKLGAVERSGQGIGRNGNSDDDRRDDRDDGRQGSLDQSEWPDVGGHPVWRHLAGAQNQGRRVALREDRTREICCQDLDALLVAHPARPRGPRPRGRFVVVQKPQASRGGPQSATASLGCPMDDLRGFLADSIRLRSPWQSSWSVRMDSTRSGPRQVVCAAGQDPVVPTISPPPLGQCTALVRRSNGWASTKDLDAAMPPCATSVGSSFDRRRRLTSVKPMSPPRPILLENLAMRT